MARPEVLGTIRSTCESIIERRGMELVDLELLGAPGGRMLRITLDKPDGPVSVDEVAEVSEEISRALDTEDPIEGSYTLEVSSAGIERPLVKPKDYQRFSGREVKVKCLEGIEGRRNFQGVIRASGDETFVLEENGEVVEIPYSAVARAKLVVDWNKELKKAR